MAQTLSLIRRRREDWFNGAPVFWSDLPQCRGQLHSSELLGSPTRSSTWRCSKGGIPHLWRSEPPLKLESMVKEEANTISTIPYMWIHMITREGDVFDDVARMVCGSLQSHGSTFLFYTSKRDSFHLRSTVRADRASGKSIGTQRPHRSGGSGGRKAKPSQLGTPPVCGTCRYRSRSTAGSSGAVSGGDRP